jgi:hypothetical protein
MMDVQQLRGLLGDDIVQTLKSNFGGRAEDRKYGKFPDDGSKWGYGDGATLINWNYDTSSGQARDAKINIMDDRFKLHIP